MCASTKSSTTARRNAKQITVPARAPRVSALDAIAAPAVAALAGWTHRRVLGTFFAPDDLIVLQSARGLLPPFPAPWRWISGTLYPALGSAVFGLDPVGWMTVNLALHATNAALLFAWARTLGAGTVAALLVGGLFAASPLAFYPLHQIVGAGELASLACALGALIALGRPGVRRAMAGALLFATALLCKETVALLPAVLLLTAPDAGPFPARARRAALPLSLSVLAGIALVATGATRTAFGGVSYAAGAGAHVGSHLLLYAAWAADLVHVSPGAVLAFGPGEAVAGALVLGVLGFAAVRTWRAGAAGAIGLAWFLLGVAPVLPLVNQVQAQYVYMPLVGITLAIGAIAARTAERSRPARAAAWPATIVALLALAWRADDLAAKRFGDFLPGVDIPVDPWLRKSVAARHVVTDVGRGLGDHPARVVMFQPPELKRFYSARTATELSGDTRAGQPRYVLARKVTDDGRALRLFYPSVTGVDWTDAWNDSFAAGDWFLMEGGAHATPLGSGLVAQARFAQLANDAGLPALARRHLEEVFRDVPGNAGTRFEYGRALAALGNRDAARRELRRAIDLEPGSEAAALARQGLVQLDTLTR